jgi:cytochrome c heme-lyase
MMPVIPNESANDVDLSKGRERSNIPKTGSEENWVYPSPQQFYNALMRKNKEVSSDPEVMDAVVFAHNVTNEQTWIDIQKWEKMHLEQCKDVSLVRFVGRSEDLSPKAWFSHFFLPRGKPFDRHDWYVDRCGKQIRYVIDYYDDPRAENELDLTLDTRPALDSFSNLWDRIRFRFQNN